MIKHDQTLLVFSAYSIGGEYHFLAMATEGQSYTKKHAYVLCEPFMLQ